MPRFEYIDYNGNAHLLTAPTYEEAVDRAWGLEMDRTGNMSLADRASGTVEASDERSRAA